jgi:hypothetical protein
MVYRLPFAASINETPGVSEETLNPLKVTRRTGTDHFEPMQRRIGTTGRESEGLVLQIRPDSDCIRSLARQARRTSGTSPRRQECQ